MDYYYYDDTSVVVDSEMEDAYDNSDTLEMDTDTVMTDLDDTEKKKNLRNKSLRILKTWANDTIANIVRRCSNKLDYCLLIGSEQKPLEIYMQYCSFNYFMSGHGIGNPLANGYNFLLNYYRQFTNGARVVCSSILKSSRDRGSDNLFYEYVVGKYLNRYISNNCPFFVHTHGLFRHRNGTESIFYGKYRRCNPLDKNDVQQLLPVLNNYKSLDRSHREELFRISYHEPESLCILIESVPDPVTLYDILRNDDRNFYTFSLVPVLFQIYSTLNKYRSVFTHYDLHSNNILLTRIPGYYFEYVFALKNKTQPLIVTCEYILKIIDYGRAYCAHTERFVETLCRLNPELQNTKLCDINKQNYPGSGLNYLIQDHYLNDIKSSRNNISADLRLLTDIFQKNYVSGLKYAPELFNLGNMLVYDNVYCTQEIKDKGYPNRIYNVSDAYNFLLQLCNNPLYQHGNRGTKVQIHIDMRI